MSKSLSKIQSKFQLNLKNNFRRFLDVVNKFFNDTGLIVMKDNGETRIGEFVMAKLEDVNV